MQQPNDEGTAPKRQKTGKTRKVKFLDEKEVIKLSSANPRISPTVHGTLQISEAQKNLLNHQHASHPSSSSSSKGPTKEHRNVSDRQVGAPIRNRKVQFLDFNEEKPPNGPVHRDLTAKMSTFILGSGVVSHCHRSNIEKSNIQNISESFQFRYYYKHLPSSVCAWRGQFQIEAETSCKVYGGFEAQTPCVVHKKVHEISKKMPSVLQLEALPASNVLIDVFPNGPPSLQDIALYFFPLERNERSRLNLKSILELLNADNLMLRSFMDGVELLLFTSSHLNKDSRGTYAALSSEHFLWGVFSENKVDNAIQRLPDLFQPRKKRQPLGTVPKPINKMFEIQGSSTRNPFGSN